MAKTEAEIQDAQEELTSEETTQKIVSLLQDDGRMAYSRIAKIVGVSEGTVRNRVRQLIDQNIIGIQADATPKAFGYNVNSITLLKIAPGADIDKVAERFVALDDVYYVVMVSGSFDLGITSFHKSTEEFRAFLTEHCYGHKDISDVDANLNLKIYKVKTKWRMGPQNS